MNKLTSPEARAVRDFIRTLIVPILGVVVLGSVPALGDGQKVVVANDGLIYEELRMGTAHDVQVTSRTASKESYARTMQHSQPIHLDAAKSDPGPLKTYVAAGTNPNGKILDGVTPLQMAAVARNDNISIPLKAGTDPTTTAKAERHILAATHAAVGNDVQRAILLLILMGSKATNPY